MASGKTRRVRASQLSAWMMKVVQEGDLLVLIFFAS